jgi:hypothetical protein
MLKALQKKKPAGVLARPGQHRRAAVASLYQSSFASSPYNFRNPFSTSSTDLCSA